MSWQRINHSPFHVAATAFGLLTLVDCYSNYLVSGSGDFLGISTLGRIAGDCVQLTFTTTRWLRNGASVGVGFAPLLLFHVAGLNGCQDINLTDVDGRCTFQLRPDSQWQIIAGGWS
jgi:hypothetical protein